MECFVALGRYIIGVVVSSRGFLGEYPGSIFLFCFFGGVVYKRIDGC
jgi:hypothetical protein